VLERKAYFAAENRPQPGLSTLNRVPCTRPVPDRQR